MVNYVELKIFNFDFALKHAQPVYSNSLPVKKKLLGQGRLYTDKKRLSSVYRNIVCFVHYERSRKM